MKRIDKKLINAAVTEDHGLSAASVLAIQIDVAGIFFSYFDAWHLRFSLLVSGDAGLIGSRHFAEGDGQPVPAVDRDDGHRQIDQLNLGELCARLGVDFVRRVGRPNEREAFRPRQRRAFMVGVERRFALGAERVQPLFAFAARPSCACQ